MDLATLVLVFAAGLCFGSFVTLASYRLPRGEDIIRKPSRCPSCDTVLKILDLFPVLSWMRTRGRCRHCKKAVHWRYPLIELICGILFALIYLRHGTSAEGLVLMGMSVALMIMIVADLETFIIPDLTHMLLIPLGVIHGMQTGVDWAIGAVVGLSIGLSLCYGYKFLRGREGLGFGDVKFLAVAGLWLGARELVPFLFFSGLLGVATALIWRLLKRGIYFPFGPALAMSLFLCVLYPEIPATFWTLGGLIHP